MLGEANHSRTVVSVLRPPASKLVILKQAVWVWEDGARRPPSYFKSAIWPPKIIRNFAYQSRAVGLRATSSNTHRITSSSTHPRASEIGYLREDGARRPSSYYDIPCLSRLVLRITASQIIVGRWPPCHVLQQEARVFTPLSRSTFGRLPEQERGGDGGGASGLRAITIEK